MNHEVFMGQALTEAQKAFKKGEVPIGAVIVHGNQVIAKAHNQVEELKDPTAHAEILVIKAAAQYFNDWRLDDCIIYVTKEPCVMCAGAMVQTRLKGLVYGTKDLKVGAAGSVTNLLQSDSADHQLEVIPGILAEECLVILQKFFQQLRAG